MRWPKRLRRTGFTLLELTLSFAVLAVASTMLITLMSGRERLHTETMKRFDDRIVLENFIVRMRDETYETMPDAVENLLPLAESQKVRLELSDMDGNNLPIRHLRLSRGTQMMHCWRIKVGDSL